MSSVDPENLELNPFTKFVLSGKQLNDPKIQALGSGGTVSGTPHGQNVSVAAGIQRINSPSIERTSSDQIGRLSSAIPVPPEDTMRRFNQLCKMEPKTNVGAEIADLVDSWTSMESLEHSDPKLKEEIGEISHFSRQGVISMEQGRLNVKKAQEKLQSSLKNAQDSQQSTDLDTDKTLSMDIIKRLDQLSNMEPKANVGAEIAELVDSWMFMKSFVPTGRDLDEFRTISNLSHEGVISVEQGRVNVKNAQEKLQNILNMIKEEQTVKPQTTA